jgi:opacity protein-like surface antigen
MKKVLIALILTAAFLVPAAAADTNGKDFGVGLYLGSTVSASGKYDLSDELSVVGGLGVAQSALRISGGVQYNFVDFSIERQNFNVYAGGTVYIGIGSPFQSGMSVLAGVAYYFKDPPIEVFFELGPGLSFNTMKAELVGGIGARWEFDL